MTTLSISGPVTAIHGGSTPDEALAASLASSAAPLGLGTYPVPSFDPTELEKQTLCLFFEIGRPGTRRKVDTDEVEVDTDKSQLHISKDILSSEELNTIKTLDNNIRRKVVDMAVPSATLKAGIYRVKTTAVMKVREMLTSYATERNAAIDVFMAAYPTLIKNAESQLGDLFDISDYPMPKELRDGFRVRWAFKAMGVDVKLKGISEELFAEEHEKAKAELAGEIDSIRLALQTQLLTLVSELESALTPDEDGKQKRFSKTRVEKLNEFAKNLADRDPTNDPNIKDLAAQAAAALDGIDADVLRKSKESSSYIQGVMGGLKAKLAELTENAPKRMFNKDDF